mmetsp:Transcript_12749/g.24156  ORF Transcript_12749/g.24156 Transcript_12749/m.24156 type:complete len:108 (+) Transcript_12749:348-671(+)
MHSARTRGSREVPLQILESSTMYDRTLVKEIFSFLPSSLMSEAQIIDHLLQPRKRLREEPPRSRVFDPKAFDGDEDEIRDASDDDEALTSSSEIVCNASKRKRLNDR